MPGLLLLLMLGPVSAAPKSPNAFADKASPGPVVELSRGEYVLSPGVVELPDSGWQPAANPNIYRMPDTKWRTGDFHTLWGRFQIERSALGPLPLALYTLSTRNQFIVRINGSEIFRNYAHVSDQKLTWYRPYLIAVPDDVLLPGKNEITIRAVSQDSVGIGRLVLGPHSVLQTRYQNQFFWSITAPLAANFTMLVLGLLALSLWLRRRNERELLYLLLSSAFSFLRNYQYFAEVTPFHLATFNALTVAATYFAAVFVFAFYATYIKAPGAQRATLWLLGIGVPLHLAHWHFWLPNVVIYVPAILVGVAVVFLAIRETMASRDFATSAMALVMMVLPVAGLHDFMMIQGDPGWFGQGAYLSVFTGFVCCTAFLIAFGARAVAAFGSLENTNSVLAARIEQVRAELRASESAREALVVSNAVASERDRLMQEMHDGIGSNLVTALVVAEKQQQPASTIGTLRRALTDLKITVDSLEPVDGSLATLLGNLRHRVAPDLRAAGIACRWEVGECRPLGWLDAVNALHILRIFQEAISNVLSHAGASELRIGCREEDRDGKAGIASFVADDGQGFHAQDDDHTTGKGMANMHARADALHGLLHCRSAPGSGTTVTLWLPFERSVQCS